MTNYPFFAQLLTSCRAWSGWWGFSATGEDAEGPLTTAARHQHQPRRLIVPFGVCAIDARNGGSATPICRI
jgi:hypothetical protein